MNKAAELLFSIIQEPPRAPALFSGAVAGAFAGRFPMVMHQSFKPFARTLEAQGFAVFPNFPDNEFRSVFVLLAKNVVEARYDVARALQALKPGGVIACAGANDAGGRRAVKMLREFGVVDVREISGNKSRAAYGIKGGLNETVRQALIEGAPRLMETGFVSQPGLFAWDKIDKGSVLLAKLLPPDLNGAGADFGCGYGFLSREILKKNPQSLACIDADWRAVEVCRKNTVGTKTPVRYLWEDLTKPVAGLSGLDWIVTNPPFHEGKNTDSGIGADFINTAAVALRSGGTLYMVANANLPYEESIRKNFSGSKKIFEGEGFKVLSAVR